MSRLRGESRTYRAKDGGIATGDQRQRLLENFMAQEVLHLALGAQVMLIKNIDETLVNGSMGIVVAFREPRVFSADDDSDSLRPEEVRKVGVMKALALNEERKRPVVDFNVPGGGIRQIMLEPETWKVELPNGDIQASRLQVRFHDLCTQSIHIRFGIAVSSYPGVGDVDTQVARSDTGQGKGRPREGLRERHDPSFAALFTWVNLPCQC